MSTSDDEKCINKSKIDYNELPKLETKILNRKYTREMLKFHIKKKKSYYKLFKRRIRKKRERITSIGI